jgi:DNA-binding GntR family transcriptional regulator
MKSSAHKTEAARVPRAADSVDRVYSAVKALAVEYRFRPGEKVNEVDLARSLSVSRTPVREALNRLVRDGFISFVPNRGFYARDMDPADVAHLYELRAVIEHAAFILACERATDAEIRAAAKLWDDKKELFREQRWNDVAEADEAFHMAIAAFSKNPQLVATLEGVNARILFFRRIDIQTPHRRSSTYDEHAQIIRALRKRDMEGAELLKRLITLSSARAMEVTKEGLARIFFGGAA